MLATTAVVAAASTVCISGDATAVVTATSTAVVTAEQKDDDKENAPIVSATH